MALKSFLRSKGYTLELLRNNKKFSHDLVKALRAAEAEGLGDYIYFSEVDRARIRVLNALYSSKQFEYRVTGSKSMVPLEDLRDLLARLVDGMKSAVVPSVQTTTKETHGP